MKTLIIGAGLAGITSSYYLNKRGHDVTVLDINEGPAEEASFANGGQISISQPFPWSSPNLPQKLFDWIGREDAPLVFRAIAQLEDLAFALADRRPIGPSGIGEPRRGSGLELRQEIDHAICGMPVQAPPSFP